MSCDYSHDKHMQESKLKLNNLWENTVGKRGESLDQHWITGFGTLQQCIEALTSPFHYFARQLSMRKRNNSRIWITQITFTLKLGTDLNILYMGCSRPWERKLELWPLQSLVKFLTVSRDTSVNTQLMGNLKHNEGGERASKIVME